MTLEKIIRSVKSFGKAALLTGALAVAGCGLNSRFHFERGPPTCFSKRNVQPTLEKGKEDVSPLRGKIFFTEWGHGENKKDYNLMAVDAETGSNIQTIYENTIWNLAVSPKNSFVLTKEPDEEEYKHCRYGYPIFKRTKNGRYKIIDLEGNVKQSFKNWSHYGYSNLDFKWAPDEKRIFFSCYIPYGKGAEGIYSYCMKGWTHRKGIYTSGDFVYDHNPAISPDGKKIAFVHHESGNFYWICVMEEGGINKRELARGRSMHDENLELQWAGNNSLVYKLDSENTLYYINVVSKAKRSVFLRESYYNDHEWFDIDEFPHILISPDKKTLAAYEETLYFVDMSDLRSCDPNNEITLLRTEINAENFEWSPCSNYFVVSHGETISVYDKNCKLQWSIDRDEGKETYHKIGSIGWAMPLEKEDKK